VIREIEVDGVFVAIGHDPNSTVFKSKLDMDANGYLVAKHGSLSNIPGVFIAGDVQDHRYRAGRYSGGLRLHGGNRRGEVSRGAQIRVGRS